MSRSRSYLCRTATFMLVLIALAYPAISHAAPHFVELKAQPGTEMEQEARRLNSDLLQDAARHHDQPVILTGTAPLARHGQAQEAQAPILFVQLQSYRLCGSAGCTTSIYRKVGSQWETLLDSVNGSIALSRHYHHGMADLLIDGHDRWIYDGTRYQDTLN